MKKKKLVWVEKKQRENTQKPALLKFLRLLLHGLYERKKPIQVERNYQQRILKMCIF